MTDTAAPSTTVVICVYTADRWHDIVEAVRSVQEQSLQPLEILLVVDHNPDLLERLSRELPGVRIIPNAMARGLSGGRNTGLANARGELVAFLDDDAVADRDWLAHLTPHFEDPAVLGATAFVAPIWRSDRPGWFPNEFMWTVGCLHMEPPPAPIAVRNVSGGAAVIRKTVFDVAGGFMPQLGRGAGALPISCEETELCIRAKSALPHGRFVANPASIVRHKVSGERLTWRYFCLRCYAEGLSKACLASMTQRGVLSTERDYILHILPGGAARAVGDFVMRRDLSGLLRAAAIVLGVGCAAAGFAHGRLLRAAHGDIAAPSVASR